MRRSFTVGLFALLLIGLLALPKPARAQGSVADFYRGRNVTIIVGYSSGGGYDTYTRILARHLGKHIPGNPSVVVQNMARPTPTISPFSRRAASSRLSLAHST